MPFVVVGNKADLEEKRQVSYKQGKELADTLRAPFFEVLVFFYPPSSLLCNNLK